MEGKHVAPEPALFSSSELLKEISPEKAHAFMRFFNREKNFKALWGSEHPPSSALLSHLVLLLGHPCPRVLGTGFARRNAPFQMTQDPHIQGPQCLLILEATFTREDQPKTTVLYLMAPLLHHVGAVFGHRTPETLVTHRLHSSTTKRGFMKSTLLLLGELRNSEPSQ